jgi:hypothetical protein
MTGSPFLFMVLVRIILTIFGPEYDTGNTANDTGVNPPKLGFSLFSDFPR